jgi:hypothetical protein
MSRYETTVYFDKKLLTKDILDYLNKEWSSLERISSDDRIHIICNNSPYLLRSDLREKFGDIFTVTQHFINS